MKQRFHLSLALCILFSLFFYGWQNLYAERGGNIALPKALWLGMTAFFWLVWPALLLSDQRTGLRLRRVYLLFWIFMLLRMVAELYLLSTNGWQYRYGIGHNLSSGVLLLCGLTYCHREEPRVAVYTLAVMALMFAAESGFAVYIAQFNSALNHAALWFLDWQSPHVPNQIITTLLVLALGVWLYRLNQLWAVEND